MLFEDFDLSDDLLDALYAMHFEKCTPIQEKAIPVVLDRHDLIAIAQTGTGKTAAYLLPVALRGFFPGEDIDGASLTKCEVSWRMLVHMVLFSALVFLAGMFPNGLIHAFSEIARAIM